MKSARTSLTALFLAVAVSAAAGTSDKAAPAAAVAPKDESIYDKIWSLPTLYKNEDSDFIQEFSFVGRLRSSTATANGTGGRTARYARVRKCASSIGSNSRGRSI